jgi:anthranilate phosphoribosyltransferase
MFPGLIDKLQRRVDLTVDEAAGAMESIMDGRAQPSQIAGFLVGLAMKGERPDEIVGLARTMRGRATPLSRSFAPVFDTCGTGGDGAHTFNVSTCAAFVAAAAGAKVAKHMGRSVSSSSGSAEVLESLGANVAMTPSQTGEAIDKLGLGFMFAPAHHSAMKYAAPVRKELGVRTLFNILGPLTNPAGAPNILMGVFHPDLVGIQVRALQRLDAEHAVVVYGKDGMDEVSLGAATLVGELKDGEVREYEIHPEDFGLAMVSNRALKVGSPAESRAMLLEAIDDVAGTPREIVVFNAGVALYAANVADSIGEGVAQARSAIASGAARRKLDEFVATTQRLAA